MSQEQPAPVILIDGSSYLYRAFHALPPLQNSKGQQTGAVKGVINMIRRMINDYPASQVAVVFDAKGKTFRNDIYPDYKAHRPPMPDELRSQIEPIHKIIQAMGLPLIVIEGVEADDVIGTLAKQATEQGVDVVISTGDKDMAQLVNQHVTLINTMNNTAMDSEGVSEKFGIPPDLIIDFLALMGDKSDNIPGVPGVGEKTALALLQGLGGLDHLYANLDKIAELGFRGSKTMAPKLEKERESAYLSYTLATIKTDVEMSWQISGLAHGEEQEAQLLDWYQQLEFKGWVSELQDGGKTSNTKKVAAAATEAGVGNVSESHEETTTQQQVAGDYQLILELADFERWLERLKNAELFAFDTETTSLKYMQARVVGVSFAVKAGEAAYVPFGHDYLGVPQQLSEEQVLGKLKPLLEDPTLAKVGQNLKYDKEVLKNHGINLQGIKYDTMLESYVLNSIATRHDMDSLALRYLDHQTIHFETLAGKGAKQLTFNQIKLEDAAPYAGEDADITLRLHQTLWPLLSKEESLKSVLTTLEIPLIEVLCDIERTGALVDGKLLGEQSIELGERLQQLQKEVYELAGEAFNLASPKQLGEILFNKLSLPVIKKTPKGAPSTAEEVLAELALDYPLPKLVMEYRGLAKLKSTYTDKLPEMINPATARIHTSYHQAVAATGRLSSSDPNLQNIPIRTAEGRRIRQAFVAPPGFSIVAADYSQIELRIMAHLSKDSGLLEAFTEGRDVHKATAAEVFAVDIEQVTTEMRRSAKAINFGLIYGMSAFGLGKQLNVGRNEAQQYMELYFERYPGVKQYMDDIREKAHEQGYVETLFGRRLYLPEINARNKMRQAAAERTAINAPMQGTAADIIKKAMISVHEYLRESDVQARIIMQVHDELVLEVADDILAELSEKVCALMMGAAELDVPLLVEAGVGLNWDEAH